MGKYQPDMLVTVYPFTQQPDGTEVIIGNDTDSSFLSVSTAALDILASLAESKTVRETQACYEQQHGQTVDIEAFLDVLESEGFISVHKDSLREPSGSALRTASLAAVKRERPHRAHFASVSQDFARRITSWPVVTSCSLLIGLGLAMVALEPSLIPPPAIFIFPHHMTLLTLTIEALVFGSIFLHELAHLVAARAAGVSSRLSLSHRLWFLVAQTDMTGIWKAPKPQRYLAFLAGPLIDATSASAFLVLLWGDRHGLVRLPATVVLLAQAFLLTYLFRLLWQCFVFVRTDFYYVIAHAFNCKNLMADSENFLRNQLIRIVPTVRPVDQSAIPLDEMRIIRCYSLFWLAGRAAAFAMLIFVSLPILWGYGIKIVNVVGASHSTQYEVIDALVLGLLGGGIQVVGLVLWMRSLYNERKRKSNESAIR